MSHYQPVTFIAPIRGNPTICGHLVGPVCNIVALDFLLRYISTSSSRCLHPTKGQTYLACALIFTGATE